VLCALSALAQAQLKFSIVYSTEAYHGVFSGKVVVYLAPAKSGEEPRFGPDWFNPSPMYSATFQGVSPGHPMVISDDNVVGFPGKLSDLVPGDYQVQAVVDRNLGGRALGSSPGNIYSVSTVMHLNPHTDGNVSIVCDQVVPEPVFKNTVHTKLFKLQSKLLTEFYGRPTYIKGVVLLPDEYLKDLTAKFPVYYEVPGFGGDYMMLSGGDSERIANETHIDGTPILYVFLDPNVPTGHCVFADSANNGPWGQALTTEYIPAVEGAYRGIGKTSERFVGGHSSGGWSSLWLQVAYPEVFGGVWSTSPDPVDFHLFQLINLYDPNQNMFKDVDGKPIPLARQGTTPSIFYKPFSDMERPIRGEQLGSFEAVFSPKGSDGQPEQLWNRDTGAINQHVVEQWKKYDIAMKIKDEWPTLGPKLKGKLHVFCGDIDTFYLDGALKLLKAEMTGLPGSDAEIEIVPGDHFTMMSADLRNKIHHEMAEQIKKGM
jgi:hypothetical protein